MDIVSVGGVIEVDEALFRESFKGNHKKSSTFTMPESPIKEALKAVLVVRPKREKRVYPRNRSAFFVLWIGLMVFQLNILLTICIGLNGLKSLIQRRIL